MSCQITEGWIEIGPGNMPEDLLDIKERETNGHDHTDQFTDVVLVTDQFKAEIKECRRVHVNYPYSIWFWQLPIDFNRTFEIRYWKIKNAQNVKG